MSNYVAASAVCRWTTPRCMFRGYAGIVGARGQCIVGSSVSSTSSSIVIIIVIVVVVVVVIV